MSTPIALSLEKKKWAVIGARQDPATVGYKAFKLLEMRDYQVFPVNPNYDEIEGVKCYPSIADLPEVPEVVDMVVNPQIGIKVMKDIAKAGIKCVWLQPGTRSDEIREFAAENDIELIEDCILIRLE